jgi:hypothetical protein
MADRADGGTGGVRIDGTSELLALDELSRLYAPDDRDAELHAARDMIRDAAAQTTAASLSDGTAADGNHKVVRFLKRMAAMVQAVGAETERIDETANWVSMVAALILFSVLQYTVRPRQDDA